MAKGEKRIHKAVASWDDDTFVIDFAGDVGQFRGDTSLLPDVSRDALFRHGVEAKHCDSYGAKDITPAQGLGLVQKIWDNLMAGLFATKRTVGEPKEEPIGLLARALVIACERTHLDFLEGVAKQDVAVLTFEQAKVAVEGMDRKTRNSLRQQKAVAFALVEVKAEGQVIELASFVPAA